MNLKSVPPPDDDDSNFPDIHSTGTPACLSDGKQRQCIPMDAVFDSLPKLKPPIEVQPLQNDGNYDN